MTTSYYCLSFARNVIGAAKLENLKPSNYTRHIHLPKIRASKVHPPGRLSFVGDELRLKPSTFRHPFASVSSFAEAGGGEEEDNEHGHGKSHEAPAKQRRAGDEDSSGMAQAFNISSRTATAISVVIAFAALSFPLFMQSVSAGTDLKIRALSYATLLFGFYMAWNIGANDVANAMGTSVGSGALTLRQAVLTAAVLEFSGALLMGRHVTSTMQKGILVAEVFQGKDTLLFAGLLSALAAAGTWLQVFKITFLPDSCHAMLAMFQIVLPNLM